MRQIDVPSAAPALPQPSAAAATGYFTDGDPVSDTPATVVPAEWLNMVMMELVNLIVTGGGLVPSKTDFTQVLQAVQKISGGSANFASPGHIKFGSGLILNWGFGAHKDNSGAQPVVFDQPFGTAMLCAVASNGAGGGPPVAFHGTGNYAKAGMTVYSSTGPGSNAAGAGTAFTYFAVGY